MSKSSDKRREAEDLERAEKQGGVIRPEEQELDPANTGPAGSNPEAEPAGSGSAETASAARAQKEKNKGKHSR